MSTDHLDISRRVIRLFESNLTQEVLESVWPVARAEWVEHFPLSDMLLQSITNDLRQEMWLCYQTALRVVEIHESSATAADMQSRLNAATEDLLKGIEVLLKP